VKNGEFVLQLDSIEEALIGALSKQNGVSSQEQLRRIIKSALDEAARNVMRPCEPNRH
jgi:hypothetical protein